MIFYFSGTGNSFWVAKELGKIFNERLLSIADELNYKKGDYTYSLEEGEKVFFVFPVHSWGPAVLVWRFLKKINFLNYKNQPIYAICVCGDNCGYTTRIIDKLLRKKSLKLTKGYSIQMPNNYILMKGFGVDPKEVEERKLNNAPQLVNEIARNIRENSSEEIYEQGKSSFLKSYIVYPLFRKFAIGRNSFYAKDNCISCGLCVDICPTKTITLIDDKPKWNKTCVQCTACIHRCPVQAIEYGKVSVGQGRYHHPEN